MNIRKVIVAWLRDYLETSGAEGYIIGLSGGIDSTVSAALAVEAIGAEKVLGVCMPCLSEPEDQELSYQVAEWLDIKLLEVDLSSIYNIFEATMPILPRGNGLGTFNVKPRLRMTTLYRIANAYNYLVVGTGNKSELLVGYFTKYGDGGVDLLPIGDLYKNQVQKIAKSMKVPARITERLPSAGLWPGQTDEEEMGITYDDLDQMLMGTKQKDEKILNMMAAATHKLSMPPICILGG